MATETKPAKPGSPVMLYLNGSKKSYRCEVDSCGANVFTKISDKRYRCNGCGAEYVSDDPVEAAS